MNLQYHQSKPATIGMELEVRLLDPKTFQVKNCAEVVFENLDDSLKLHIHQELLKSMIEIVTPVCNSVDEAVKFISSAARKVSKIGQKHNFCCAALPLHPFEENEDNEIYEDPRYKEFEEEFQIIIRNFLISGLHIHIGVEDEQKAVNAYNMVIKYIPIFLALSANSPFHYKKDTGLSSYRTKIFDKLPRAGIPEYFDTYEQYCSMYQQLFDTNTIKTSKDVWWDVRIAPRFGTVELRVCDALYNPHRLKFIGLLYQALIEYGKNTKVKREFHQINLQNKWNATRYGMDADFIEGNKRLSLRNVIKDLIDKLEQNGILSQLNIKKELQHLIYVVDEPSLCKTLRDNYKNDQDFKRVIQLGVI